MSAGVLLYEVPGLRRHGPSAGAIPPAGVAGSREPSS